MSDPRGLHHKFTVHRTDGTDQPGGKHHGCSYFVLDLTHDAAARSILPALADAYDAHGRPGLARDLRAVPVSGGEPHTDTDECPQSQRVDGPLHSWQFDGDDPYIVCAYCGERRDARTGRVITSPVRSAGGDQPDTPCPQDRP